VLSETEEPTRGDEVGGTHIRCRARVVELTFLCEPAFVFDRRSGSLVRATTRRLDHRHEHRRELVSPREAVVVLPDK
jgi:hypothetical protein